MLKNTYYLIRHGECLLNLTNVNDSQGNPDNVLTSKGREQVESCGMNLAREDTLFEKIVSSPFVRAKESAELLSKYIKLNDIQILYTDLLKEMNHGSEQEGKVIQKIHAEITPQDLHVPHGDGESYWDVRDRMKLLINQFEELHEEKNLILLTHGTPVWMFYSAVYDLTEVQTLEFRAERKRKQGFFIKNAVPLVIEKS